MTFAEKKQALDEIALRVTQNAKRLKEAENMLAQAEADLINMQQAYAAFVSAIDGDLAADAKNAALMTQRAEKDLLVADFTGLKQRASALRAALAGV